jgi:hypothetical protein
MTQPNGPNFHFESAPDQPFANTVDDNQEESHVIVREGGDDTSDTGNEEQEDEEQEQENEEEQQEGIPHEPEDEVEDQGAQTEVEDQGAQAAFKEEDQAAQGALVNNNAENQSRKPKESPAEPRSKIKGCKKFQRKMKMKRHRPKRKTETTRMTDHLLAATSEGNRSIAITAGAPTNLLS